MKLTPQQIDALRGRCRHYPWFVPASFRNRFRTLFPWIFPSDAYWKNPSNLWWDGILAHEGVHLDRQSGKKSWVPVFLRVAAWLTGYEEERKLHEEAAGIAAEIEQRPHIERNECYWSYVLALTGEDYTWVAGSELEAGQAIQKALRARGCDWVPGPKV